MGKVITLPLVIDGHESRQFVLYLSTNAFNVQPSDQEMLKLTRVIADAINKGNPA